MKKVLIAASFLISINLFSADIKNDNGSMNFPDLKLEKVEGATYIALASKSGEAYIFGLANDVFLDVELYNVSLLENKLVVKPTYEDFTIEFTQDETNKIFKAVKEEK